MNVGYYSHGLYQKGGSKLKFCLGIRGFFDVESQRKCLDNNPSSIRIYAGAGNILKFQ